MLELKDLIAAARENPTDDVIRDLWRAVFLKQAWYFLPAQDVPGPSSPLVTEIDGENWVLIFTNFRRLAAFARDVGRRNERGDVNMLILDPLESMRRLIEVRDHVSGAIFNARSEETFRAPLDALEEYARFFELPL